VVVIRGEYSLKLNPDIVSFEITTIGDSRYKDIRDRHYIPNKGCIGQQIHFLIHYHNRIAGIISGASPVYCVKDRDDFFGIPQDSTKRQTLYLPTIVGNNVFRLEYHAKNLGTMCLSLWRKAMIDLFGYVYGVQIMGYETFIIEKDDRKGSMYKADNWIYVGETKGDSRVLSGSANGVIIDDSGRIARNKTEPKMIYCRFADKIKRIDESKLTPFYGTANEKAIFSKKEVEDKKANLNGVIFTADGKWYNPITSDDYIDIRKSTKNKLNIKEVINPMQALF